MPPPAKGEVSDSGSTLVREYAKAFSRSTPSLSVAQCVDAVGIPTMAGPACASGPAVDGRPARRPRRGDSSSGWRRPDDALARAKAGEFDLIFPTMKNLEAISRFTTSAELLAAAAAVERVPTVLPRVVVDERGFRILLPGDPGYDDASATPRPDPARGRSMTPSEVGAIVRTIGVDGRAERRD